ncbi:hypothetical protein GCM10010440_57960 [Kitasatospora cinereorecta]
MPVRTGGRVPVGRASAALESSANAGCAPTPAPSAATPRPTAPLVRRKERREAGDRSIGRCVIVLSPVRIRYEVIRDPRLPSIRPGEQWPKGVPTPA